MSRKESHKALTEKEGVDSPEITHATSIAKIKERRKEAIDVPALTKALLEGHIAALSRAITLIESTQKKHRKIAKQLIESCLPYANTSIRIGITGVPGVGKSTFIEAYGNYLTQQQNKVAVLAVDPSSSVSKGSILGDKTRMEELVKNPMVFIRPSASGESLGGVARKTREAILLCEAAGYPIILIETVGVGQSETAVHSMVDFFLLLKLAGAGDELQGIKRGIMEMADTIVINKADGENIKAAKAAQLEFKRALHLYREKEFGWKPKVLVCSALNNEGIPAIHETITSYIAQAKESGYFEKKRFEQNKHWLMQTIDDRLKSKFYNRKTVQRALQEQLKLLETGKTTPFAAAEYLLGL
ncbi:MAG TPA: methylmalonyl Co-A mutase-associated GTPase MeaB [Flavobacteriaceae bacterium]|nr:methylmalonyl Co-A mutase-associated GTPase MeaB [Flavobacteriaceae bacterium]